MSQLIKIETQEIALADHQFDLLKHLTFCATKERIHRVIEQNSSFFKILLSIHFPFESAWIEEILPYLTLGSTHYSHFDENAGMINYASLGLTFNRSVSFPALLNHSKKLKDLLFSENGAEKDAAQLPLDLGLEREYKLQANRSFAIRNQLSSEVINSYFDFEEEMLKMRGGSNIYSLQQLEAIEYKYMMLYHRRIYLNFKPYMKKDFVISFFKNLA